ncbi:MBL fold metallo-hydrolase [Gemmobacter lutimaris]|nr:MBL fold metallo-hydrolase [Gemmobacter lutimaris]
MRVAGDSLRWDGAELIRLHDGAVQFGQDFFPDPRGATLPEAVVLPVQAYLLRRPGAAPVLIDTGSGALYGDKGGRVLGALAALGLAPEDIGDLVLTHLHGDHCGGLLSDLYTAARLHVGAVEADYWAAQDHAASGRVLSENADRIRLVQDGEEIAPGLRVWSLPGHTPGQIGLVIDNRVAVVGDMLHRADIQLPDPRIATKFDVDPAQAVATRLAALKRIAAEGWAFCAGHARLPGQEQGAHGLPFLRLEPAGEGWRAVAA